MKRRLVTLLAAACTLATASAVAHGDGHARRETRVISGEQHDWGREGDPRNAKRTVRIEMSDAMRYSPARFEVKRGETLKLVVRNRGKVMHELVIGTRAEMERHAELMRRHPGMEHDEPYMAHVPPGQSRSLTWTFDKTGTFMYGCLVPGHWEAGMQGSIEVKE